MEMDEIIKKVNYFSKLSRERVLTADEEKERAHYRRLYIELFKKQVRGHLENIEIVDKNKIN